MNTDRPLIMGILNVTPDSFSDGGEFSSPELALQHALQMLEEGADMIDIGGESTRPGADTISGQEQLRRVIPVIELLRKNIPETTLISIDTTNSTVADIALKAGANWINDVSAAEDSPKMLAVAVEQQCPIVLMHRQGLSATMQDKPHYNDVTQEVVSYLKQRAQAALDAGVSASNIILDPGIGFGKTFEHNLTLMADLKALVDLGYQVLLGTSRKRFLSEICNQPTSSKLASATSATTSIGVLAGVAIFRVHDVLENRQVADVTWKVVTSNDKC
ncbi:MAG TPA: dihydropteroate synthase [Leucothrix mucor]|uniref:Dihydropteroate synthase n=1 Tax=Leucothrix mucor TaxID=45248 RepID=A0A7V2T116_LEUMU|nr:dihydropteroate synthase [Leucothrix mucor]